MGIIRKIALRNMKRKKTRYILTTIALIVGVALFGGIMIASDSFYSMMLKSMDQQMGTADILVRKNKSDGGWFDPDEVNDILKDTDHVDLIAFRIAGFSVYVSSVEDGGNQIENSTKTTVDGIDITSEDEKALGGTPYILDAIKDVEDADTIEGLLDYKDDKTGTRVIVISETLKIKLGVEAGDRVQIFPNEGAALGYYANDTGTWLTYTITAVVRDSGESQDFDPENPSGSSSSFSFSMGSLLFVDIERAHELVDGTENHENEVTLGVVGVDDMHNANVTAEDIDKQLGDLKDGKKWVTKDLKSDSIESVDNTMTTMRAMFMMFGLIALILSLVLITNIFNIIKEEQSYETGMFQAIGASKSETFKMFITQGVVMGTVGALIGTVLSYFISYWIFNSVVTTMQGIVESSGMGYAPMAVEITLLPTTIIATFAIGFVSCLFASIYPSYKASKKPLIECLNPIEEKSEREKKRYLKKMIYATGGSLLIIISALFLFDVISVGGGGMMGPPGAGGSDDSSVYRNIVSMTAPTYMLLGIIILTALLVRPLSKGLIHLFGPYLKQTKLLTEKNILRHRKRTVLTFSMIALTVSYLVGMTVSMDSMRAGIDTTVDDFMGCDARVFAFGTPRSLQDELLKIDGVDDVMGIRYQSAMVKVNGEWIGHGQLEEDYEYSININVIDTKKVKDHMNLTELIAPSGMNLDDLLNELESGKKIVITDQFASDFNVEVGDSLPVKFGLGVTYPSIQAMLAQDTSDAQEETLIVELKVAAIVKKIQGFMTGSISFGSSSVTTYPLFISWDTFEKEVAPYNLPGKGTDLIYKQMTQTGNWTLDPIQSNWFNFSSVEARMNSIDGIEYYTSRMDYTTLTNVSYGSPYASPASVVGIHTNSSGKLRSDMYFGANSIVEKDDSYSGSSLEELLNNTENVCVVDEMYANIQRTQNPTFGIGSNVSVFPLDTDPVPILLHAGSLNASIIADKGRLFNGSVANLTLSDNINLTYISSYENLSLNLNYNLLQYLPRTPKSIAVQIESGLNATVTKLELRVLNTYTSQYDKLGDINKTEEYNYKFNFNPLGSYIDATGNVKFKIIGQNLTATANYTLDIDCLMLNITQSKYDASNSSLWPSFEVIGIINTPKLYETERYFWPAGYEAGSDASGNAVYINYDKARNIVYPDFKGSNRTNDKVTSVLVHCENVEDINSIKSTLLTNLILGVGGMWSIVDLKTTAFRMRKSVLDWYFWFDKGVDGEHVLSDIQQYLEDHGYIVLFGFTRNFMISTFVSMINLMSFITDGMLILAIIISLIGLALHSLLTTMSRKREIGMLRSIGLSKKGVVRSIAGETLIVSLLGVLVGIFAGLIQGILMVISVPAGGFITYTLVIPWVTIAILILITVTAAILSSLFPARWAANLNIIDAVRTR